MRKFKKRDKADQLEILKLILPAEGFNSLTAFKAAIGQRGLNFREVVEAVSTLTVGYEGSVLLNFRFDINRSGRTFKVNLIGPTSTYIVTSVLGEVKGRMVNLSEVDDVFEAYREHWLSLSSAKGARSMILGKLRSLGAVYNEE